MLLIASSITQPRSRPLPADEPLRGPELASVLLAYLVGPHVIPEVLHETNIDRGCHSRSAGVQRGRWCADKLGEQAVFAAFNAGINGAGGLNRT
jgi:hypothetical protein